MFKRYITKQSNEVPENAGISNNVGIGAGVGVGGNILGNSLGILKGLRNPSTLNFGSLASGTGNVARAGLRGGLGVVTYNAIDKVLPKGTDGSIYQGDENYNNSLFGKIFPSGMRGIGLTAGSGALSGGVPGTAIGLGQSAIGNVSALGKNIYQKFKADRENEGFDPQMAYMNMNKVRLLNEGHVPPDLTQPVQTTPSTSSSGLASSLNKFGNDSFYRIFLSKLKDFKAALLDPKQPMDLESQIPMNKVDSSHIDSIGYLPKVKTMQVDFRRKDRPSSYRYSNIPIHRWEEFRDASSKGKYFNSQFRGLKDYKKTAKLY